MITAIDKNTALVLIDLQKGIVSLKTVHPVDRVLKNAARLVDAFRKKHLPIVIVNVNPTNGPVAAIRKETLPSAPFSEDSMKIVPEIVTQPEDIFITKKTWNAFTNPSLHQELQKRHVTGIVLGGISTSIGVEGTARAASELGYNISFAFDAMTDRVSEAHEHSIKIIFPRIGESGTTEEIIKKLPTRI